MQASLKRDPFLLLTEGALCLMLTFFPLFFGPSGYLQISEAKFAFFTGLMGLYLLALLFFGVRGLVEKALRFPAPAALLKNMGWPRRFLLLYLLFTWVSALLSPHFPRTLIGVSRYEGAVTITLYGLVFLCFSHWGRPKPRHLALFGGSVTLLCLVCLLQFMGLNPFGLYPGSLTYFDAGKGYSGVYLGTIGNADLLAAFLSLAIPPFWIGLLRLKDRRRFLLLVPLALSLFVLLRMEVLAGFVGVFGGGVLCLPFVLPLKKRGRRRFLLALLALCLLLVLCLFFFDLGEGLAHELHGLLHGNFDPSFGSGRLYIWGETLRRVPERPLLGTGPDTMLLAGIDPFTRYDPALGRTFTAQIDVAHNEYLNLLFHQGVFALLSYLAFLISLFRRRARDGAASPLSAMLGTSALCYCLQAFFSFSTCLTAPFFWLALALPEAEANR